MGSRISMTSAAAASSQTGAARSSPSRRLGLGDAADASAMAGALGAEELHEARLDLFVALLELLRVQLQGLEIPELRPGGGGLHLRVAGVEAPGVGEDLLDLPREDEVGEEPGRVGMGREARDRARGDHQRHALLREHDLHRIALLLELVEGVVAAVYRDRPLPG